MLKRLAVADHLLIGIGEHGASLGVVAFALDTRRGRLVMLEGKADAERRVLELKATHPSAGWVNMYELPLAPRRSQ